MITGKSLAGECLTNSRLGVENISREIYAQSVSRAGFFEKKNEKTEMGIIIANIRSNVASSSFHTNFVSKNVVN